MGAETEDATTPRRASCSCGRLTVAIDGEPVRISMCHCRDCQRRTGSVYGVQARFHRSDATIDGPSTAWTRTADSGNRIVQHFCPTCGTTVFYLPEQEPGLIAVAVGAFADASFPAPRFSVYEARKHPWVVVPEELEHAD